jgi:hypothetical protein
MMQAEKVHSNLLGEHYEEVRQCSRGLHWSKTQAVFDERWKAFGDQ